MNVGEALSWRQFAVLSDFSQSYCPYISYRLALSDMMTSKVNWHAVYTYPNQEKKIYTTLVNKNIESYLPLQRVIRRWSDRTKVLQVPLFPNYLFVHINNSERGKVLGISGVTRILSFEGRPAIIPDTDIQTIRQLENTDLEVESVLVNGDRVQIIQGPFAGLVGTLFEKQGKKRFGVQLTGLKQSLSLEICGTSLKKLSPVP